ncbi:hypothetical protein ACO0RG_002687 [Hanseniaspora osmophila]|uniref:Riboflavin kinase n=1 Tax=Hanseniaspora osmophila TaxID=56408 RepID=A0A1E5R7J2_9ASCO|nr:Riboflavin kinase [Hanseniaspora osmophila]
MVILLRNDDAPIYESGPIEPFPIGTDYVQIQAGFGRGSAELGIPTANVPLKKLPQQLQEDGFSSGIYFGYAKLKPITNKNIEYIGRPNDPNTKVEFNYGECLKKDEIEVPIPVVFSVGYNVFYGDLTEKVVELHFLHHFDENFYGCLVKFTVLGYIRPERNYPSLDELIKAINTDKDVTKRALGLESFQMYKDII